MKMSTKYLQIKLLTRLLMFHSPSKKKMKEKYILEYYLPCLFFFLPTKKSTWKQKKPCYTL